MLAVAVAVADLVELVVLVVAVLDLQLLVDQVELLGHKALVVVAEVDMLEELGNQVDQVSSLSLIHPNK
jgi:hypothetical protein